jgi:Lrp/AsnC family transcriptional regulator for asnA, asnC and gidA
MHEDNTNDLDPTDFAILKQLQKDGRKSFTEIAEELNLSIGTIRKRVNKLVDDKTLEIVGRVAPERVGFHVYAHIFVSIRPANLIESVANQIAKLSEVSFVAMTSGEYELEVNVMCRDNDHLVQLMNTHLHQIEGIQKTQTNMYLKVFKIAQPDLNLVHIDTKYQ